MKIQILSITKNILKKALLLVLSVLSISCSKENNEAAPVPTVIAPEQNPLPGFLEITGFNQKTVNYINQPNFEFGISFIPLVDGKMTAIVVKIPDTQIGLRVTIWDKSSGEVLKTEIIDITTANVIFTKSITALNLLKDKEYIISFNSNDYCYRSKTNDSQVTYPVIVGDLKITSVVSSGAITFSQTLPKEPRLIGYPGDISFKFQK